MFNLFNFNPLEYVEKIYVTKNINEAKVENSIVFVYVFENTEQRDTAYEYIKSTARRVSIPSNISIANVSQFPQMLNSLKQIGVKKMLIARGEAIEDVDVDRSLYVVYVFKDRGIRDSLIEILKFAKVWW